MRPGWQALLCPHECNAIGSWQYPDTACRMAMCWIAFWSKWEAHSQADILSRKLPQLPAVLYEPHHLPLRPAYSKQIPSSNIYFLMVPAQAPIEGRNGPMRPSE